MAMAAHDGSPASATIAIAAAYRTIPPAMTVVRLRLSAALVMRSWRTTMRIPFRLNRRPHVPVVIPRSAEAWTGRRLTHRKIAPCAASAMNRKAA